MHHTSREFSRRIRWIEPRPRAALRVLLVDGALDRRERYAAACRLRGFCTLQAGTVEDGYRLAVELLPAVVIVPMTVTDCDDGMRLARTLKQHADTMPCRVILLTDDIHDVSRQEAWAAGCDCVIATLCDPDKMAALADDMLTAGVASTAR